MLNKIFGRVYPYLSITTLEITKHVEIIQNFGDIFTLLIQTVIGGLTVYKLLKELQNKFKNKENGK